MQIVVVTTDFFRNLEVAISHFSRLRTPLLAPRTPTAFYSFLAKNQNDEPLVRVVDALVLFLQLVSLYRLHIIM